MKYVIAGGLTVLEMVARFLILCLAFVVILLAIIVIPLVFLYAVQAYVLTLESVLVKDFIRYGSGVIMGLYILVWLYHRSIYNFLKARFLHHLETLDPRKSKESE